MPRRQSRPVFYAELGRFFELLRTSRQWGESEAASLARRRGLKTLTRQVLIRLEKGATKFPRREVLEELAVLYGLDYRALVQTVTEHAYNLPGVTYPDQTSMEDSPSNARSSQAGVHVASIAHARVVQQRDSLIAAILEVKALLNERVADLIDADPEIENVVQQPTRARRSNRKARG